MKKLIFAAFLFASVHVAIFAGGTAKINGYGQYLSGYPVHFAAFFALTAVTTLLLMNKHIDVKYPFILSFIYASFMAFLLEAVQSVLPYRTFSMKDFGYGILGSLIFVFIGKLMLRTKLGRKIKEIFT